MIVDSGVMIDNGRSTFINDRHFKQKKLVISALEYGWLIVIDLQSTSAIKYQETSMMLDSRKRAHAKVNLLVPDIVDWSQAAPSISF